HTDAQGGHHHPTASAGGASQDHSPPRPGHLHGGRGGAGSNPVSRSKSLQARPGGSFSALFQSTCYGTKRKAVQLGGIGAKSTRKSRARDCPPSAWRNLPLDTMSQTPRNARSLLVHLNGSRLLPVGLPHERISARSRPQRLRAVLPVEGAQIIEAR